MTLVSVSAGVKISRDRFLNARRMKGFHTACRLAGIEGLIWKDLRATFGTRLAEAECDAFTKVILNSLTTLQLENILTATYTSLPIQLVRKYSGKENI